MFDPQNYSPLVSDCEIQSITNLRKGEFLVGFEMKHCASIEPLLSSLFDAANVRFQRNLKLLHIILVPTFPYCRHLFTSTLNSWLP